jgi:GNAT superfamily N-acetyltransferase
MSDHQNAIGALHIREATSGDIPEILRQRRGMYEDMGYKDVPAVDAMLSTTASYLARAVADGSFRSWIGSLDGKTAGGGAVLVSPWPSHPYDGQCRRATILNVYTYPKFRRRGVARQLMQAMIAWCRQEEFLNIFLHASKDGRSLYESLGFLPSNEMKLVLRNG